MKQETARRKGRLPLVACALLAAALLWSSLLYHLFEKRAGDLAQARRDAANISTALSEEVARLFESADQLLRLMQADHDRDPARFDLDGWIARSRLPLSIVNQVATFDARGDIVAAMRRPAGPGRVNIADRPAFTYLASHPDAGLYIGHTYASRLQPARVVPLVRRLSGPDGAFAGTINISIDPDFIERQFQALDIGAGGSVALLGHDGYIRARSPAVPGMFEKPIGSAWWRDGGSPLAGIADDGRGAGPDERIDATRDVPGLPLAVAVGFSRDDVLAPWRSEAWRVLAFGLVATAILVLLAGLLIREQDRREARERALRSSRDALAEAEDGFRDIFDSLPEVLVLLRVDPAGAITLDALNAAARSALAIGDEALDRDLAALPSDRLPEGLRDRIATVAAQGQVSRLFDVDDGDVEALLVPLFVAGSRRVARIFLSLRDVSHLRRAESAVIRSEERFRLIAEAAGDMITRLDPRTFAREYVSPGCRRLLGFEPEELLHRRPLDDVHPEDKERLQEVAASVSSGEGPEETITTYRTRHRAGHWVWVEGRLNLARDVAGAPVAMVCSVRDVTERLDSEAALRASELRFRLLAENTSELIVLGRQDGGLTYVSPASRRLFGFTPDELTGEMAAHRWVHPEDRERLGRASAGFGSTASAVCRVRHSAGHWVWVEAIVRSFAAGPDEPTIIATFRDVSERVAQAQALQRAKEAAEQASQAKSDFLAAMSHEIRTPLNAVLGYADLVARDGGLTAGQLLNLERIQNAGSALRTVVDDVLDFSKIEAGEISLTPRPFRPLDLVDNALSIMRGAAQQKGLLLSVDVATAVPATVVGDHDRLRQVLLNLLNNAVKFTAAGTITLSVSVSSAEPTAAQLRFCVADTGIGIPASGLDRLFQRFSQVDGSISREFGGTGLGLAICRRLVEAMGGRVGVESEVGRGSSFWFDVRLALVEEAEPAAPVPTAAADAGLDVLLVEDQLLNRDLARAMLGTAGHRVVEVCDGAAAVAAVLARSYDVVLMDVQMPVMDGLEATRRIRALPHGGRDIPIVAMTANVLPAQVAELKEAGADDHVGKPFRRDELLNAVARAAGLRRPVRMPAKTTSCPVFDLTAYRELEGAIGLATVNRIVKETLAQVALLLTSADRSAWAMRAHALLGTAGTVGLLDLAAELRALEHACLAGGDAEAGLRRIDCSLANAREAFAALAEDAAA